jgi:hypothetical protein
MEKPRQARRREEQLDVNGNCQPLNWVRGRPLRDTKARLSILILLQVLKGLSEFESFMIVASALPMRPVPGRYGAANNREKIDFFPACGSHHEPRSYFF